MEKAEKLVDDLLAAVEAAGLGADETQAALLTASIRYGAKHGSRRQLGILLRLAAADVDPATTDMAH
jgi:hypothetical protein